MNGHEQGTRDARGNPAAGVSLRQKLAAEWRGLIFCLIVAVIARALATVLPHVCGAALAIALGLLAGNLLPLGAAREAGLKRAATSGLEIAIALLGLTIPLSGLPSSGALGGLVVIMLVTLAAGALSGRLLGLGAHAGLLGGMGSAVCGSAAIAASAPLLRVNAAVVAAALASINLLSAGGMIILPAIAATLGIDDSTAGWWTGGSLQAVGQAVGAGFAVSPGAGETATAVKLFRVAMLVGLLPALGLIAHERGRGRLPWFVVGFVLSTAISGWLGPVQQVRPVVAFLLALALAGIGARIHPRTLLAQGPRMLLLCALLFLVQFGGVLLLIRSGLTGAG
ncbi:hypothetical protein DRQ32_09075 [bacterium]|nr:MAG: hypothetical protein DRQ32_09075 [bacterium]